MYFIFIIYELVDNILIIWYIKFQTLTFSKILLHKFTFRMTGNMYNLDSIFRQMPFSLPQNKSFKKCSIKVSDMKALHNSASYG